MSTLLIRTVLIYLLVFGTVRIMGKRQISDMQPFDLVITLLIADLASAPISDSSVPLLYGVIPILGLFILHWIVSFLAMRSNGVQSLVCGHPIKVIEKGVVVEEALRAANYTLNDLMEQLRLKDVFSISEVEYAILETNGSLSVLRSDTASTPKEPSVMLISDGVPMKSALASCGFDDNWLAKKLSALDVKGCEECLFACYEGDKLIVQNKSNTLRKVKRMILELKE